MSLSNYPPGVTGNEYQIAGADYEIEEIDICYNEFCPAYGLDQNVTIEVYRHTAWWTCDGCNVQHDWELDEGPDPDDAYDRTKE